MKLFQKYLLQEIFIHSGTFFITFSLLFSLPLGTLKLKEFLHYDPPLTIILKIYFLTFLQLLSFLIPLSTFFGLLYSFYEFKEEREFLAFISLGYTIRDFIPVIIIFLFITFFFTFISHFYLLPLAKRTQKLSQMALLRNMDFISFFPKKPIHLTENLYIYVQEVSSESSSQHLKGVLLFERKDRRGRGVYLAEEAHLNPQNGSINLKRGSAFFQEQYKNLEVFYFQEYSLLFSPEFMQKETLYIKRGEMTFAELKEAIKSSSSDRPRYMRYLSEYYQRLFYSFSVFPLLIQAVFMGFFLKSYNRFIFFFMGVSFYLFYYFSYNFFLSLGERGKIEPLKSQIIFYGLFIPLLLIEFRLLKKKSIF